MASHASSVALNPYNPVCSLSPCLQQVIGQASGNPLGQFAACTSLFGSPTVSTVTPSDDVVFSTSTLTSSYTDIIVSLTTTTSTAEETIISFVNAYETTTVFTTTIETTLTTTTAAPTYILVKKDAGSQQVKKKRRGCGGHPPASSSAPPSEPSSVAASSAPTSSVPASSVIFVSSSAAPSPEASICPSAEEYSSACDCIGAVSAVSTVTEPALTSTSIMYETITTTIPSVTESTITVIETTVIIQPTTTTATTTLNTAALTTVTAVTTTTPVAPTQTAYINIVDGPGAGNPLKVVSSYVQWASTGTGTKIAVSVTNQTPWLPGQPTVNLYLHSANTAVGVLYFESAAQAGAYGDLNVKCSVDTATGYLSCATTAGHTKVLQCGTYVYLANPTFMQSSCTETRLKLNPWLS